MGHIPSTFCCVVSSDSVAPSTISASMSSLSLSSVTVTGGLPLPPLSVDNTVSEFKDPPGCDVSLSVKPNNNINDMLCVDPGMVPGGRGLDGALLDSAWYVPLDGTNFTFLGGMGESSSSQFVSLHCEVCLRYFYQKPACNSLYADGL